MIQKHTVSNKSNKSILNGSWWLDSLLMMSCMHEDVDVSGKELAKPSGRPKDKTSMNLKVKIWLWLVEKKALDFDSEWVYSNNNSKFLEAM